MMMTISGIKEALVEVVAEVVTKAAMAEVTNNNKLDMEAVAIAKAATTIETCI